MQSMPYVLVTRNPNVKTIADFTDKDKIALPAVKLTGHAIALEIEAARIWGPDHFDKLDSITITRSHADAAAAVMGVARHPVHLKVDTGMGRLGVAVDQLPAHGVAAGEVGGPQASPS